MTPAAESEARQLDLRQVADRTAISDVVYRYATAMDSRDWPLFQSCFADEVEIDFSSWHPDVQFTVTASDWVQRVKIGLSGFDTTQHYSSNHVHTLDGDRATCVSYMRAEHFLTTENGLEECTLGGYYTNTLIRTGDGWKIKRCQLTITWFRGDYTIFERARARYEKS